MFTVLYENDDIIAVAKPENIASIPERRNTADSVVAILSRETDKKVWVVHRLDKEVSGVILFAKNAEIHRHLNRQFEERRIRKTYLGLVWGQLKETSGEIAYPVRAFGSGRMGVDHMKGKPALTGYQVLQVLDGFTLLNLFPHTGRRHQIRVHLYALGYPLAGDIRYGDRRIQETIPRLMLHASSITFEDRSKELIRVPCPLPESFRRVLDVHGFTAGIV